MGVEQDEAADAKVAEAIHGAIWTDGGTHAEADWLPGDPLPSDPCPLWRRVLSAVCLCFGIALVAGVTTCELRGLFR
jgi:hypothetical protein